MEHHENTEREKRKMGAGAFISGSGAIVPQADIPARIADFYERNKHKLAPFEITIGTDSQNFSDTKIVTVVSARCVGHGGIFFYRVKRVKRIEDVTEKLREETNDSLETAAELVKGMEEDPACEEAFLNCPIALHVDAGNAPNGKTARLIPELVGWVNAMGYECVIKPESYAASSIADMVSK